MQITETPGSISVDSIDYGMRCAAPEIYRTIRAESMRTNKGKLVQITDIRGSGNGTKSQMGKHNDVRTWILNWHKQRTISNISNTSKEYFVSGKNKLFDFIFPVHRARVRFACHSDAATLLQAFLHYVVTQPVSTSFGTAKNDHSRLANFRCHCTI